MTTQNKVVIGGLLLLILFFITVAWVNAQETPVPPPPLVTVAPGCEASPDALVVVCVQLTTVNEHGQFAGADFYVQAADRGWVQLTECDDLIVLCNTSYVRAEGVNQGDAVPLVPGG